MIGIDVVLVRRFRKIKKIEYSKWKKVFSKIEWQYTFRSANPAQHLAGIFAAKEAIMKAVGGNFIKRYDCIDIGHLASGKPVVKTKLNDKEKRKIEVSISHEKDIATAIAIVIE